MIKQDVIDYIRKKDVVIFLLYIISLIISVLVYIGLKQFGITPLFILQILNPFTIPAIIIAGILVFVSLWWSRRINRRTGKLIHAFFFGVSLYFVSILILIIFLNFVANLLAISVGGTELGGFYFIVATIFTMSFGVFYIGLLLLMFKIIRCLNKDSVEEIERLNTFSKIRHGFIFVAVVLVLYVFGAIYPIAYITNTQYLCNLIYKINTKSDCYINTSSNVIEDRFNVVENPDSILGLTIVDHKLAYDPRVNYDDNKKQPYTNIKRQINVGGKVAYVLFNHSTKKNVVMWDGKEYGANYVQIRDYVYDIDGELAFVGIKNSGEYIVAGNKEYGPYSSVSWVEDYEGHLVAQVIKNEELIFTLDGQEYGVGQDYRSLEFIQGQRKTHAKSVVINGEFVFATRKDGRNIIISNNKEIAEISSYYSGPYVANNKLVYVETLKDKTSQLIVDGQKSGPVLVGKIDNVSVSEDGSVAIKLKDNNGRMKVYINGEVIYDDKAPEFDYVFGFYGEKLLFTAVEGDVPILWYDGIEVGKGYSYFEDAVLVGDKLVVKVSGRNGTVFLVEQ